MEKLGGVRGGETKRSVSAKYKSRSAGCATPFLASVSTHWESGFTRFRHEFAWGMEQKKGVGSVRYAIDIGTDLRRESAHGSLQVRP
jgi:hypothetical protein